MYIYIYIYTYIYIYIYIYNIIISGNMASDVVFSELLCFLNSLYDRVPLDNSVTVICTYFGSEDILYC